MPAESNPTASHSVASFVGWHPVAKLALWFVGVGLLAGVIQAAAWLVGSEFSIWSHGDGGRGTLILLALGTLLVMMAAERRPAAEYGLVADEAWARELFGGLAIGVATYAGYCALCVAVGALELHPERGTWYRWSSSLVEGLAGLVLAGTQQVIFSGYLFTIFRRRYDWGYAAAAVGLLFAGLHYLDDPAAIFTRVEAPLACGLALIAGLLCLQRLAQGGILLPTGLLGGWLLVRRVVKKTALLSAGDGEMMNWWCPDADPRRGPVLWLGLIAAIAGYAWWIRQRGEGRRAAGPAISTSFKQVAPLSNVCMLAPLDLWLGRLFQARWQVGWKYLPRLAAIFVFSSVNTLLTLPERVLAPWLLRRRQVTPPVFILGVHRSGTTHLHNLLALDPALRAPLAYQIMNPHGFLSTGWLWVPLFGAFSPWQRPMDSVRFHIFSPNEEEFALAGMTRLSPYWGLSFPREVVHYDRWIHPRDFTAAERSSWQRHYLTFVRKLVAFSRRRPVLKNPHNTARVSLLHELFPQAKFIHIHRHPYAVYRSNQHMAREGHCVHQLQDPRPECSYATRFLDNYRAMEEAFYADTSALPSEQVAEVRFEELEADPRTVIRRVYAQLGLEFSPAFAARLDRYLASVADYTKNRFRPLPDDEARAVEAQLGPLMDRWGYPRTATASPARAA